MQHSCIAANVEWKADLEDRGTQHSSAGGAVQSGEDLLLDDSVW